MKRNPIIAGGGFQPDRELTPKATGGCRISGRVFLAAVVLMVAAVFGWPQLPDEWRDWLDQRFHGLGAPEALLLILLVCLFFSDRSSNDRLRKLHGRGSSCP